MPNNKIAEYIPREEKVARSREIVALLRYLKPIGCVPDPRGSLSRFSSDRGSEQTSGASID